MVKKLFLITIAACIIFIGCKKQDKIVIYDDSDFSSPITGYALTNFLTFRPFRAKLVEKDIGFYKDRGSGITNSLFYIYLEKTNEKPVAVYGGHVSEGTIRLVRSLEKGCMYTFPDVLQSNSPRQP